MITMMIPCFLYFVIMNGNIGPILLTNIGVLNKKSTNFVHKSDRGYLNWTITVNIDSLYMLTGVLMILRC